jgi:two-component system CheB/CheR fusion protein
MVRQLLELHGGTISAESEGLDRGSRFTIRLPLVDESKTAVSSLLESTPLELTVPPDTSFLIVDDSRDTILMLEQLLSISGATVTTANNGADALRIAAQNEFDMILSDISMPEMDGFEFLRRLRQIKGRENVPVVCNHWIRSY